MITTAGMFSPHVGRNEALNHGGNAASAGLAALLAWWFGPVVVFWLMGFLAICSVVAATRINPAEIDDRMARGLSDSSSDDAGASGFSVLLKNRCC